MPVISEWLQLMLGEIARKREELERSREEEVKRQAERLTQQGSCSERDVHAAGTESARGEGCVLQSAAPETNPNFKT